MKNRYAGACSVCNVAVGASEGDVIGPPWVLKCLACAGKPKDVPVFINVKQDGAEATFNPSGRLDDTFSKYRAAIDGCRYDGKVNRAKLTDALRCIEALRTAGFKLNIEPALSASLQALSASLKGNVIEAEERADEVDEKLRARGLALFPFQRDGVKVLAPRTGFLLADDMGLGKTIQALIAAPRNVPVLVIGPSVAKGVWRDETAKWRPDMKVTVLKGRGSFRWPQVGEMVVTNYDILPEHWTSAKVEPNTRCSSGDCAARKQTTFSEDATPCRACAARTAFDGNVVPGTLLIGDEVQAIKESKSLRTKRFRGLAELVRAKGGRTWGTTATPMTNRPPELWNILVALGIAHEAFGSYRQFEQLFDAEKDGWGGTVWGQPSPEVPERLRRVSLRRTKVEVLTELPEKTYRNIPVDLDPKSTAALDKMIKVIKDQTPSVWDWLQAGEEAYETESEGTKTIGVLDIAKARAEIVGQKGTSFHGMSHARELLARAKIPAMFEVVEQFEEQNEPLVVFCCHRAPIDMLKKREGWAVITGDIPGEARQQIAKDFQDGKYKGVACTIDAGGVAITLTRASQCLFVDRDFTPALNTQAEDRVYRIGQTRGVIINRLIANHPLDRLISRILADKTVLIDAAVNASAVLTVEEAPAVPEVDFEKLAAEARAEAEAADKAVADAQRIAEERAKEFGAKREQIERERKEQTERERAERKQQAARQRAKARGWVEDEEHPERHEPVKPQEKWAAQALIQLAASDPDHAYLENGVGFSKSDSYMGHWLSVELPRGLTPKQWKLAIGLCRIYHRQVGQCPSEKEETP